MARGLATRELLVVTGKGGVGKSAVASALGLALADAGHRVLVLETDPRETVHQMFDAPPSGGEIRRVGPRLYLQNLSPRRVLDDLVRERLKFDTVSRRVLASPVYQHFVEGGPGLKELAVLGETLRIVRGESRDAPEVDLVVLDAPASGHGVSLLAAPLLVAEVIQKGPIGRMTTELAGWIRDRAKVGVVAVTQAEEMPVTEVLELAAELTERLNREIDLMVVNGLYPPVSGRRPSAAASDVSTRLWLRRRDLNERELERLAGGFRGPKLELPLLPHSRGPALVAALAGRLASALEGAQP